MCDRQKNVFLIICPLCSEGQELEMARIPKTSKAFFSTVHHSSHTADLVLTFLKRLSTSANPKYDSEGCLSLTFMDVRSHNTVPCICLGLVRFRHHWCSHGSFSLTAMCCPALLHQHTTLSVHCTVEHKMVCANFGVI